jgi:hypothetical protein
LTQSFRRKINPSEVVRMESPRSVLVFESLWFVSFDPSFRIPKSHP